MVKLQPKIDALVHKAPSLVESAERLLDSVNATKLSNTIDTINKFNETVCVQNKGVAWPGYRKKLMGVDVNIPEMKIC